MMQSVMGSLAGTARDVFMPENVAFTVLAFLGTGFALFVAAGGALFAVIARKPRLLAGISSAALALAAGYAGTLLFFSMTSGDVVLARGDRKYFCEIDCHTAYSVGSVARAKAVGPPSQPAVAAGTFAVVRLKTWFDERTISSRRGNAPLTPNPRRVYVVDASGRKYLPDAAAGRALAEGGAVSKPLDTPLSPGEAYETVLAFDLPGDVRGARLLLTDAGELPERFLIGHEKSFFHRKVYFALDAPPGPPS